MNSYIILSSSKSPEFHVTVAPQFFIENSSVEAFITDLTLVMNGRKKVSVVGLEEKEFTTKSNENVQVLTLDKEENLNHFLNAASNEIVRYLLQKGVQCFIIGWSKGFKNEINLGRKNNQNFVSIPHGKFRDLLIRKCAEVGIKTIVQEESYTSKASFVDNDFIPVFDEKAKVKHKFSGRRVKRGEYRSRNGSNIHADVNAAWNILRKCKPSIGWNSRVVAYPENLKIVV